METHHQSYLEYRTSPSSETTPVILGVLCQSYLKDILLEVLGGYSHVG